MKMVVQVAMKMVALIRMLQGVNLLTVSYNNCSTPLRIFVFSCNCVDYAIMFACDTPGVCHMYFYHLLSGKMGV